jgi:hypothetical protein
MKAIPNVTRAYMRRRPEQTNQLNSKIFQEET